MPGLNTVKTPLANTSNRRTLFPWMHQRVKWIIHSEKGCSLFCAVSNECKWMLY